MEFKLLFFYYMYFYKKAVKDIMKSINNVRNDRAKKEQAKKWSNMPAETKTKVITKWEEKAKVS